MQLGLIGAGNMASALARGWGDPVLCTDSGSGRAAALAAELGGEALPDNAELARRADVVVLAHKPAQLVEVAQEAAPQAKRVISVMGRTSLEDLRAAYPGVPVSRIEPNTPVALRQGVSALAAESDDADMVQALFERVGTVVRVPERLMTIAGGVSGVGPAYLALVAEAWVDAAVRRGMPAPLAAELVTGTLAGTAALLAHAGHDTLALRRGVASPGGTTARGLAALEREGLRAAFAAAMDDVVDFR
ncbi:MAG TPA: pyrroline-5-carboxylate reductase [Solirubrobacteraceae bacterium]|nr:pyrroline-5-carboxylate reductase [Solirubrobacteraceae bacterium]